MSRNRSIVMPHHRTILSKGPRMKKNRNSSELAARIAAAASQPAGRSSAPDCLTLIVRTKPQRPQALHTATPARCICGEQCARQRAK